MEGLRTMKPQRSKPQKQGGVKSKIAEALYEAASMFNWFLPCFNILSLCSIPDYTESAKALFDYITSQRDYDNMTIVWHVKNPKVLREIYKNGGIKRGKVLFVRKNRFVSFLFFCLSRYIVDTHGLYSMVKMKNRQKSLYLTHGMPVKKFGFEYDNDIQNGVQFADYALATSDFYKDVISRSMGINEQYIISGGLPRNDIFFQDDDLQEKIQTLLSPRYYLYLPTYRVSDKRNKSNGVDLSANGKILGGTIAEWEKLNGALKNRDSKIVIKPHPMEQHNNLDKLCIFSQVIIINDDFILRNELTLNRLMKYSMGLITDYSGAFIDYLLVDKPIVFFMPDYTEYRDSRGYVLEGILKRLPGDTIYMFKEISNALWHDNYKEARRTARELLNIQTDATVSSKISEILFSET